MKPTDDILGKVVVLKDGLTGVAYCQLQSGQYLLMRDKGGRITESFTHDDVINVRDKNINQRRSA